MVPALIVLVTARRGRSTIPAFSAILAAGMIAGLLTGNLRLAAIDGQVLTLGQSGAGSPGQRISVAGTIEAEPGRSGGAIRFRLDSDDGRLMVEAPDPGADRVPGAGDGIEVEGTAGPPPDWYRPVMERHGLRVLLRAERVTPSGTSRGGLSGVIDRMRRRGEHALARGMPRREAALARGFVLGQDAAIDDRTTSDFRASGLSHLLAVSGQNVVLLGLLAWPVLALLGAGPQARRIGTALLILIYIPLAGGGASIQRAGAMGIAALAVAGAGRAVSRLWVLALAAAVTLGLDPRSGSDPGWQLSFAAVIGIALLASPLRSRLEGLTGTGGGGRPLAEGAAVTLAASLATAPLIAFHFGRIPVGTVAANLAVLPAIAPAMWLGMISAAVGQVWSGLALPFNLVNSVLLAMIARVAFWFGRPDWAQAELHPGPAGLALMVVALAVGCLLVLRIWRPVKTGPVAGRRRLAGVTAVAVAFTLVLVPVLSGGRRRTLDPPPPDGARIELFDVGQGDAILLRPADGPPTLIDGGPPGGDLSGALASAGVDHLAAVMLTHRHLDHYGGLFGLFPGIQVDRFLYDSAPERLLTVARNSGARITRVAAGDRLAPGGGMKLELLWPNPALRVSSDDPNERSLAARLTWRGIRIYLPGDGETEALPVDPGPLDVLKVAHHGSGDAGLAGLLARDRPKIAVIEVGEGNRYGHPSPETLADLRSGGTRIYRTDRDGTVSLVLTPDGCRVETGR